MLANFTTLPNFSVLSTEVGWRARGHRAAKLREPRHPGIGERGVDLLVEFVDDGRGVFLGAPKPLAVRDFVERAA